MAPTPYRDPPPGPILPRRSYRSRVIVLGAIEALALVVGLALHQGLGVLAVPLVLAAVVVLLDLTWRPMAFGLLGTRTHQPWPDEPPIASARPRAVQIGSMLFGNSLARLVVFPSGLGVAVGPSFSFSPVSAFIPRDAIGSVERLSLGTKILHDGEEARGITFYGNAELREALESILPDAPKTLPHPAS